MRYELARACGLARVCLWPQAVMGAAASAPFPSSQQLVAVSPQPGLAPHEWVVLVACVGEPLPLVLARLYGTVIRLAILAGRGDGAQEGS